MRLSTHLSASALALPLLVAQSPPPPLNIIMFSGILMGTVAPDADAHGGSPIPEALKRVRRFGKKIGLYNLFAAFVAVLYIPGLAIGIALELLVRILNLKHRGALHTPWTAMIIALLGAVILLIEPKIGILFIGLAIGWIMHLVLDSLTPSGIYWWGHKISGPIVTSSFADRVVGWFLVGFGVLLLILSAM